MSQTAHEDTVGTVGGSRVLVRAQAFTTGSNKLGYEVTAVAMMSAIDALIAAVTGVAGGAPQTED